MSDNEMTTRHQAEGVRSADGRDVPPPRTRFHSDRSFR